MFLSDKGPTLETLNFITRIGSTQTIIYFYHNHDFHYIFRLVTNTFNHFRRHPVRRANHSSSKIKNVKKC